MKKTEDPKRKFLQSPMFSQSDTKLNTEATEATKDVNIQRRGSNVDINYLSISKNIDPKKLQE